MFPNLSEFMHHMPYDAAVQPEVDKINVHSSLNTCS